MLLLNFIKRRFRKNKTAELKAAADGNSHLPLFLFLIRFLSNG